MPKVPDTLSPGNGPDNEALSAGAAAGAASAGIDAGQAARTAQYNEAGVKNAQAGWLDGMHGLLFDPDSGYLKQSGAAALGGFGAVQEAAGKLYQQTVSSLGNDTQRALFDRATAPIMNGFMAQIQQHAQAQGNVYDADASRARAMAARDLGVNAWNPAPGADNQTYRQCAAILHNELENQYLHAAGSPGEAAGESGQDMQDHYLQHGPNGDDGMASLPTGIINRLLQNNQPYDARRYFDEVQHTLPDPTRDKLDQYISSGEAQALGNTAALQAQAHSADLNEQQHKLDGMLRDGSLSKDAHAIASQKITADNARLQNQQKQNDIRMLHEVWALKQANPNAALTDLSGAHIAYLQGRGLGEAAKAILDSHPAQDDPALFNQLCRQAQDNPAQFAQANLLIHSGRLSKAHTQYLGNLQQGISQQGPQTIQAGRQVADAVAAMQADTQASSASPDGWQKEPQADPQAEADLRDRIIAAQQQNGGPLSPDKLQDIVSSHQASQALQGWTPQSQDMSGQGQGQPASSAQAAQDNNNHAGDKAGVATSQDAKTGSTIPASTTTPEAQQGAAQSNADNQPPQYTVGEHFKNGFIEAGSKPDTKVYIVKSSHYGATVQTIADELGVDFDQLKELNGLTRKQGYWVANGTKLVLPPSQLPQSIDENHTPVVNVNATVDALDGAAYGKPTHNCRRSVFDAIDVGLAKAGKKIRINRNTPHHYAEESGPSLEAVGYKEIVSSADGLSTYTPRKGDVVVLQHYKGQGYYKTIKNKNGSTTKVWQDLPAGHIAMFDGKYWVSDFKQDGGSRIWADKNFEINRVGLKVYRP